MIFNCQVTTDKYITEVGFLFLIPTTDVALSHHMLHGIMLTKLDAMICEPDQYDKRQFILSVSNHDDLSLEKSYETALEMMSELNIILNEPASAITYARFTELGFTQDGF